MKERNDITDYHIHSLNNVAVRHEANKFIPSLVLWLLLDVVVLLIFPLWILLLRYLHICNVAYNEKLVLLGMFIISQCPLVCISYFYQLLKSIKSHYQIKNLLDNDKSRYRWKQKFIQCKYPTLINLIIARRYNLVNIENYEFKKNLYVSQHLNFIVRDKFISEAEIIKKRNYFMNLNQQDVDVASYLAIVELAEDLNINSNEVSILKNNFINNDVLISKRKLMKLKILEVISNQDYEIKLKKTGKQYKLYILDYFKIFIALFSTIFIAFVTSLLHLLNWW